MDVKLRNGSRAVAEDLDPPDTFTEDAHGGAVFHILSRLISLIAANIHLAKVHVFEVVFDRIAHLELKILNARVLAE